METVKKLDMVTVNGYTEIRSALLKLDAAKVHYDNVYVLFTGDTDENGISWCPDCVDAEQVINRNLDKIKGRCILFFCYVGSREQWSEHRNQFRVDPHFQLQSIPTLIKYGTHKRLSEKQCCSDGLLDLLFSEELEEQHPSLVLSRSQKFEIAPGDGCCRSCSVS